MKNFRILAMALVTIVSFSSCSDDDSASTPVNEEEVITTVTATFMPTSTGGTTVVLKSQDLDGDGPNAPIVTATGNFKAGATYNGFVTFLNELSNPASGLNDEIHAEADDHQIFFQHSGLGAFAYADEDANGNPVGLDFKYTAAATPVTGSLIVTLRHLPNKSGANVAAGDITNAGGGTDAEVVFPVTVQ
jgi:hypothetical protein